MANSSTRTVYSDAEQKLFAAVFDNSFESILVTDKNGIILRVNPAFTRVTGYEPEETIGQHWRFLQVSPKQTLLYRSLWRELKHKGHWHGEMWSRRKSGEFYPQQLSVSLISDNQVEGSQYYIIIFTDITDKKRAEEKIHRLAYYDMLTDLPNRVLFLEQLSQVLTLARRNKRWIALLFLDLDRFKEINDSLGHPVGDQLLQEFARRLRECVREQDRVARMGGDEFTVILGDLPDQEAATHAAGQVAQKILKIFSEPMVLEGREVFISVSIGIALYPQDSIHTTELIKNADLAMYHAKSSGKNNFKFYTTRMNFAAMVRMDIEHRLHKALQQGELKVFYQPQVNANTRLLCGLESSVRWQTVDQSQIPTSYFIRLAEETGLIFNLGSWVFKQVCQQVAEWVRAGLNPPPVAVNLSAKQFAQPDLVEMIAQTLEETQLSPYFIELEITESALIEDIEKTSQVLHRLKSLGLKLAIDDFGTGYSSLNYLRQFPIDRLKIDQSFVRDINIDEKSQAVIDTIIAIAQNLKLQVMAEGVETELQLEYLKARNCIEVQGYYFYPALSAEEIKQILLYGRIKGSQT